MADGIAAAWEAIVLAEAAVSYAYGIAGPRLADAERATAGQFYDAHERARDDALLAQTSTGAAAESIPAFFALPNEVASPEQARALLATVESRLAVSYADLLAAVDLPSRHLVLDNMLLATGRALLWGAGAGPWGAAEPE